MDRFDERSHFEAVGDIRYSVRYFHLQSRLFGKVDGLFKLIYVIAGSSSFAGFLTGSQQLAGVAGLVTAAVTALDIVWSPGSKRLICSELAKRYTELDRKSKKLTLEELDEDIWRLRETLIYSKTQLLPPDKSRPPERCRDEKSNKSAPP
ncbi:hypothetical protein [Pseudomonas cannabina]|nr:hypothetical protein [Pseudomonas cannabina]